jgi:hypothetical protein
MPANVLTGGCVVVDGGMLMDQIARDRDFRVGDRTAVITA